MSAVDLVESLPEHGSSNEASGVWRARFAGRFACADDASNDDGSAEEPATVRYTAVVRRSEGAAAIAAEGFWVYDESAGALRWTVRGA